MQFLHWFIDPIKNHYVDFSGRATRQQFWMFMLVYFIIYLILVVLKLNGVLMLFSLAVLIPSVAITTRRLHDIDMNGWWQLVGLIPLVGVIVMIVFLARKGSEGDNRFGPCPCATASVATAPDSSQFGMDDTPTAQS